MVAINLVIYFYVFGHDEAIGAVISSIRLSCHEVRAFVFKGYWYNLIHDLFEISLLFRITVKQTIISCVMIVMITLWTKYLTQFFSCHIKVIRPYFLQTNSCTISKILLLFISQC